MKKYVLTLCSLLFFTVVFAQVGINTITPSPASSLDVSSSSDNIIFGGLMPPKVNLAERALIAVTPADDGLLIYLIDGTQRCLQIYDGSMAQWRNIYCMPFNNPPVATHVTANSPVFEPGAIVNGAYVYGDAEGDLEGASTFQWYLADDAAGTLNLQPILGATSQTYTIVVGDLGKYVSFAVTPIALTGTLIGVEKFSAFRGPIQTNTPPVASAVAISGCFSNGELLSGSYTYTDADGDLEGATTFQWYRATDNAGTGAVSIAGATSINYTVQLADVGFYLALAVTPVALTGTSPGTAAYSSYGGAVLASGGCLPWINELHYDNTGADINEGVEIAGLAGLDLSDFRIYFYNGADGTFYDNISLLGIIDNESNNFGALWFPRPGIDDGPDGLALFQISTNTIIQFLSYEGSFIATNGPASGMGSIDIGVEELSNQPVGESLQLTGTGNQYNDFLWSNFAASSPGDLNASQVIN
ncbi:hypothetical protein [Ulvibacter antarcticus]|uniref:AIR9-like A9 domain-containing protein n=1 Tax=Ulvibacter antarcticus TaxID=442714 RepID=A0A3L9YWT1_9FLAO|nr:hypothetical protein [Ulvibacter antarcticus]RMA64250.1 hypothetical protein BXY75_1123 [Ulvibacter antarcticus]